MKVAVVDDTREDIRQLKDYIDRFGKEEGQVFTVDTCSGAEEFLTAGIHPDLLLLDIDMPGMKGIDLARRLRKQGDDTVLVFVTRMPQYALDGYQVDAVDYILKPVSYPEFALKLKKAIRYVQLRRDVRLALNTVEGVVPVSCMDILYVESDLHYLTYHLKTTDYRVRGTLGKAEKELPPELFARCNNSYLVNFRYVKAIEKEDVVVEGRRLKISRGKKAEFLDRFTRYLGGIKA